MAAPKGNQFAVGNSGREKTFESVEELQKEIDAYFEMCDSETEDVYIKESKSIETVKAPIPYTIEGLCCILHCCRLTLINYEKREGYEDYFNTIKDAKAKILKNKVERGLMGKSPSTFAIFDLINNSDYENTNVQEIGARHGKDLPPTQIIVNNEIQHKVIEDIFKKE